MARLYFLGTAPALPAAHRTNVIIAVTGEDDKAGC